MKHLTSNTWLRASVIAAAAGAFASSAALAGHHGSGESKTKSETVWIHNDDKVKTISEDGGLQVIVNGEVVFEIEDLREMAEKELAKGDIKVKRLDGGGVLVMKGDEEVVRLGDGASFVFGEDFSKDFDFDVKTSEDFNKEFKRFVELYRDNNQFFVDTDEDRPPVIMGINIGSEDDAKIRLESLGKLQTLDADEVTVVVEAIEGFPASKAGIKSGDVIVELKGHKSVGPMKLREILRDSAPGDEVEVRVLRDGDDETFVIELEAFGEPGWAPNAPAAPGAPRAFRFPGNNNWQFRGDEHQEVMEALNKAMAEASARMAELSLKLGDASGKQRERITIELQSQGEKLAELSEELARKVAEQNLMIELDDGQFEWRFGEGESRTFDFRSLPRLQFAPNAEGKGFVIVTPDAPEDPELPSRFKVEIDDDGADEERLEAAKDKLERLEDRLKRLESLLERLVDEQESEDGDL